MMNKGSVTIIVIIIALLIAGLVVVYAVVGFDFGKDLFSKRNLENTVGPLVPRDSQVEELNSQNSSDEIGTIEADLNDTDFEDLDEELEDLDDELESL